MEIFIIILAIALALVLVGAHLRKVVSVKEVKPEAPEPEADGVVLAPGEVLEVIDAEPEEESEPAPESQPEESEERAVFHLEPHKDGGWQVRSETSSRPLRVFPKKPEALAYAKVKVKAKAASSGKTSVLVVHRRDGTVQHEHAYDGDK